jgi:predicted nucleic acid-binding protein
MNSKSKMNLNQIPKEDIVMVDANICLYAIRQESAQCERLLARCAKGEVNGIITTHILAEIMHQLMIAEARDYQWIKGPNPARQLAGLPERVRALTKYEELVRDILGTGLQVEPVVHEDFITTLEVQRQAGLLTNDALLVAVGERLRVTSIASADQGFSHVQGILLYSPDDVEP